VTPGPSKLETDIHAHHRAGDMQKAASAAVEGYGPEILGFLVAILKDDTAASDVFSQFCEDLWNGLPEFRWQATFRTWAYTLARHAAQRYLRSPFRRRNMPLSQQALAEVEQRVRTSTLSYLRTEVKEGVARLRESLEPEDQALLILRIDRGLAWNEVAEILLDESPSRDAITRKAAALRKRFERVKDQLKTMAKKQGLLEEG
jgi:RNA polymerase sigma-70 factor, ECF subfamily